MGTKECKKVKRYACTRPQTVVLRARPAVMFERCQARQMFEISIGDWFNEHAQQGTRKLPYRCETRESKSLVFVKTTDVSVYIERNLIIKAVFCAVRNVCSALIFFAPTTRGECLNNEYGASQKTDIISINLNRALADPEGGLRGLQPPPLNFQKKGSPAWPL